MSLALALVDTNVVVAGLLTRDAQSPVARILDGLLAARFRFAVTQPLVAEYHAVLRRPALRKLHGLKPAEVEVLLTDLVHLATVLKPTGQPGPLAPDPGDQMLRDALATHGDALLVTGDKRLLASADMHPRVITPAAFCARWEAG